LAPLAVAMEETPQILLVEDDDGHAILVQNSLRKAGIRHPVIRCHDGQEAVDFLFGSEGPLHRSHGPLTVLLDIRMPKLDGIEVLRRIRQRREFDGTPVIMVTTTDDPKEMERCRNLGSTAHLTKSADLKQFAAALAGCFLTHGHPFPEI
jgi:CheY-like chemotaxis protein